MNFERARKIADAVLYEGYILYPYRASARKNQLRWQFGVLAPRAWSEAGGCEHWWRQTECLVECAGGTHLTGKLRFLQIAARRVEIAEGSGMFRPVPSAEIDGRLYTSWEEGIEREADFAVALDPNVGASLEVPFEFSHSAGVEEVGDGAGRLAARILHEQAAIGGVLRIDVEPIPGPYSLVKVRLREENLTPWTAVDAPRDAVLTAFFVGAHALLGVEDATFVSLQDPPQWAAGVANSCVNVRTWPVMAGAPGERNLVLSSPIILEDHPRVAPESPADLFDATEIDEILTLRTMTLTDEEKREARATDPRAAAIIDRVDNMPPEVLDRLHGAIRYLREAGGEQLRQPGSQQPDVPWWDPGADASVRPEVDSVEVAGVAIAKGSRVRLRPRMQRADAQDMFLDGRAARVHGVFRDIDDNSYLAVTLEDDPAADLYQSHGRFLYFQPDEVEPFEERS
ncbi:MAG TPA: hypothetical protein VGY99_24515 [Candidatus Binataceae bacterium]|jgi:hypothetical protein|nr:hypothetical protein [Candidatus Binataceae bacterium]